MGMGMNSNSPPLTRKNSRLAGTGNHTMGAFGGLSGQMMINPFNDNAPAPMMVAGGMVPYMNVDVPTFGKTPSQSFMNNQSKMAGRFDMYMKRKHSFGAGSENPQDHQQSQAVPAPTASAGKNTLLGKR